MEIKNYTKKENKTIFYIYEWIDCPEKIKEITTNKIRSKTPLGLFEVANWTNELKKLIQVN